MKKKFNFGDFSNWTYILKAQFCIEEQVNARIQLAGFVSEFESIFVRTQEGNIFDASDHFLILIPESLLSHHDHND